MSVRIVDLYSAGSELEAVRIESLLEKHNIPCHIMNKATQDLFALGRLGSGVSLVTGGFQFQVREDQWQEAAALLEKELGIPMSLKEELPEETFDKADLPPEETEENAGKAYVPLRQIIPDWGKSLVYFFLGIVIYPLLAFGGIAGLFYGLRGFKQKPVSSSLGIILNILVLLGFSGWLWDRFMFRTIIPTLIITLGTGFFAWYKSSNKDTRTPLLIIPCMLIFLGTLLLAPLMFSRGF